MLRKWNSIVFPAMLALTLSCFGYGQIVQITSLLPTTGPVGTPVQISGTDFGATQDTSTVQFNGQQATVLAWSDNTIFALVPSGATSGTVSVAVNGNQSNGPSFTVTQLPTGWSDQDIGSVGLTGSASYGNGTFTVAGAGGGTFSNSDGVNFLYEPLSGDGTIVARIISMQGSSSSQVGVMIRETTGPGATHMFANYYSSAIWLTERISTGAGSTYQSTGSVTLPYWVKVVRSGTAFTAYGSTDGINWVQRGSTQTINMAQNVDIGLAVSSRSGSSLTTATFDNVSVNSSANPAPLVTGVSATTGSVGTQVAITGSGFGAVQGSSLVTLNNLPVPIDFWGPEGILFTVPTGATSGYLVVSIGPSMNDSNPIDFAVSSQPLPISWLDQDVGAAGTLGNANYANGIFTVAGAGGGSYSTSADGLHFVYRPLSGDGTIIARLLSLQGGSGPEAGLMIRESLASGATHVFIGEFSNNWYQTYRTNTGSASASVGATGLVLPYWLKIVRSGNSFSTYICSDGLNWTQIGSTQTINMAQTVYVGMAVASRTASLATAAFDNVSITSAANPAPLISGISATTGAIGSQVTISGSAFGDAQGASLVTLSRVPLTVNFWSSTEIICTIPTGATSGYLVVSTAPSMNDSNPIYFTVTSQPLISPWLDQDIGAVGLTGSAAYSNGTFTIAGAGGGTFFTGADGIHFVYQLLPGDGAIVARVASLQGPTASQAGLMIRESSASGAEHMFSFYYQGGTWSTERTATGSGTAYQGTGSATLPYWLKLVRTGGNSFITYGSTDGVTWVQRGTIQTINMAQNVEIGLAVSSRSGSSLATAAFDHVSVTVGTTPFISGLTPALGGPGQSVTISGSNFGATQGSSVVCLGAVQASVTSWSDAQVVVTVPDSLPSGMAAVTVTVGSIQSNADHSFNVIHPVITGLTPPAAAPGGQLVVAGTGFGATQGSSQLQFNGLNARILSWNDSNITTTVPTNVTAGPVTVTVQGVASNPVQFNPLSQISVASLLPSIGSAGTIVTISGAGFGSTQSNSVVTFDSVPATTVPSWSDNTIEAIVPDGASSGDVTVQVAGLTALGPYFTVSSYVTLTDSLGNQSYYAAEIQGGKWYVNVAQGGGCSSCTIQDTLQRTFDLRGNLLSLLDELGRTTSYSYDGNDNVASVTQPAVDAGTPKTTYTYNSFGEVLTMIDPLGNVTTNTYDPKGNLLTVTTPKPDANTAASVTTFGYDTKGELTTITDPLSHVTTVAYNSVGLIQSITDANNKTTSYEYDARGNRTAVVDALQNRTTFAYDAGNRLTTITYPDTTTVTFGYDYRGRRTSVTDQNGKVTTYAYDDADRLTSVTDANNKTTQYAYDTENNLTSITDALGRITSFTYDPKRRVTEGDFPSTYSELYGYDAVGNLTSKTDRKGQVITYVYDALNRLTHKGYPDSTGVDYVYDLVGKIQQVNDPTGTYSFAYDNMGRLIGTTTQYSFLPGSNFTNAYTYDAASNRKTFTAPDGSTNNYTYDVLNRMTDLTNSWAGHFGFGYDDLSRRTQLAKPNGISTNYAYDSVSRLLSVLHQAGTTTVDGVSYTNDSAGNRTSKQNLLTGITDSYSYDPIYQLTQVLQGSSTTEAYTYDDVGNRLSDVSSSGWQYNSSNQLTSTPSVTNTYDQNGNTLTKVDSGGATQYNWDIENRLVSVTLPVGAGTVSFKYDPFGRRIQKVTPSGTTNYVYDGANFIAEYDASGALLAKYAQGAGIDEPLAISRGGQTGYYDADGLGSITSVIDNTLTPLATYTYDAFGKKVTTGGSLINPFQYTGREWDQETGLYYYRARYYDPATGRLLNEDPIRSGMNFYAYVHNGPINLVDPFGLQDSASPWQVGWEWLTGQGPRTHHFTDGDPFTELLRHHEHIQELIKDVCNGTAPPNNRFDYQLGGVGGVPKYLRDYSTLFSGGLTGNLAVTYLGSYGLSYSVTNGTLNIHVWNYSTISSATHPPVIGYTNWWNEHIGTPLDNVFSSGPMSQTSQFFDFHENLKDKCGCKQ